MSMTVVEDAETGQVDRLRGRESAPPIDPYGKFLKLADVMQSIGVSQAMVYKLMHDERLPFPHPVKIGRVSVWIERDVVRWKALVAGDFTPTQATFCPITQSGLRPETDPDGMRIFGHISEKGGMCRCRRNDFQTNSAASRGVRKSLGKDIS